MITGIFVGGRGTRMGGVAKGLLLLDGETLLERLIRACDGCEIVLVGNADAYARFQLPSLSDEPAGQGPIGGLHALLSHAQTHGASHVLALACDLPYLSASLVEALIRHPSECDVVAPKTELWQPLAARYRTGPALKAVEASLNEGQRSLQSVIARLSAEAIDVPERELRDWDTPDDQKQDTST
jgi:molybdopterin-guanine dinucleotide biosynthesis protein A